MCVSQHNNRLFLAIVLGMFLASGCSGHSVKYGANSEGEGMASEEGVNKAGESMAYNGTARHADGITMHGGTVDGSNPNGPRGGSDYGRQFGGVDGTRPNHGAVTGFGSGAADPSHPSPEAWANAYLQEGESKQEFYGDPSATGSSRPSGSGERAQYGQDYPGVPGSGPNYGAVEGFSQGSASQMEANPEMWAQAYVRENGGASPEHVEPDMDIAYANGVKANGHKNPRSMRMKDANGELLEIGNPRAGFEGRVQDIYFAFDSWSISDEGARYLEEDAQWLHANPEKGLTIEGHCDQRGTQEYNLVLGKKRAEAARDYLVNLGIQAHRIKIVSYGKERPFCQMNNEQCFQENRRNHMVVRMNQS